MSTGGFVVWIDRMTDWTGRQVITGFANDLLDRLPGDAVLGPPAKLWGEQDKEIVEFWHERHNAFQGVVTWSPTVDPEMLKIASLDLVLERGVQLLLLAWAVAPVQDGTAIRGVIFESKSGCSSRASPCTTARLTVCEHETARCCTDRSRPAVTAAGQRHCQRPYMGIAAYTHVME
jgi:hypothetical protein